MKKTFTVFVLMASLSMFSILFAGEIYVSPRGNDKNAGTKEAPYLTLNHALKQAREWRRLNAPEVAGGISIRLEDGIYVQSAPLFIRPEDSGRPDSPTLISAVEDAHPLISGGVAVTGWKRGSEDLRIARELRSKVWVAKAPLVGNRMVETRQMWVNGNKARWASQFPDGMMERMIDFNPEEQTITIPTHQIEKLQNAGQLEMIVHQRWAIAILRVKSIDVRGEQSVVCFHQPESRIQFEHPWPRPMVTTDGHNSAFYLTNARELQDVPGEWYHDIDARKVYYYPREGEKMQEAEVIVPAVETLVRVEGTLDRPVRHIRFEKITFSYTTWMRPSEKGHVPLQAGMYLTDGYRIDPKMQRNYLNHPLDNQGWLGRPAAAVRVVAARQIDFERCRFEHLGSTGLDYEEAVQGGVVRGCLFHDIAGNGLLVGSFSPAAHETHLPYDPADRREVCTQQQINNCYFTEIGNEDWGCLAIAAGYVEDINIEHNEISEVPYSGISLGWGWTQTVNCMRNNRVHANLIHHYAKHMYDVAGIYTLGSQPKSYVTENCVHSIYKPGYVHDPNHWFYLYTDEGSSFITVRDNWTEGEKYLQNANGPGNVWENNGPKVDSVIRERAGLEAGYKDLLNIQ